MITDFTAYDSGESVEDTFRYPVPNPIKLGLHWVGDLAVSATADVESQGGQVVLELVKGGRKFQCRLDAATGQASLSINGDDMQSFHPTAKTQFREPGKYDLIFSNCDRQLLLWINHDAVKFDSPTTYDDLNNLQPTRSDLTPVSVASQGARLKLNHLRVMRDIYYIAVNKNSRRLEFPYGDRKNGQLVDYVKVPDLLAQGKVEQFFSDPAQWSDLEEKYLGKVEFTLKDEQFFALGDNSAKSQDSRLWTSQDGVPRWWIDRDLLKGKALFIYWPHSWNRIPYVNIPFPYFPNFSRMHFIK